VSSYLNGRLTRVLDPLQISQPGLRSRQGAGPAIVPPGSAMRVNLARPRIYGTPAALQPGRPDATGSTLSGERPVVDASRAACLRNWRDPSPVRCRGSAAAFYVTGIPWRERQTPGDVQGSKRCAISTRVRALSSKCSGSALGSRERALDFSAGLGSPDAYRTSCRPGHSLPRIRLIAKRSVGARNKETIRNVYVP
jgi:hypothetical protein